MVDFRSLIDPARLFGNAPTRPAQPVQQPAQQPAQNDSRGTQVPQTIQNQLNPVDQNRVNQRNNAQPNVPMAQNGQPAVVAFPDRSATGSAAGTNRQQPRVAAPAQAQAPAAPGAPRNINTRATFFDGKAATGKEIDAVLKHYNSPHAGQGETLARICREENINPVMMVAIMQQESSFGNRSNRPSLKDENIANPWSVHFNEPAKGINKLRLKDGSLPSFEQSLRGAIRTMKNLAGDSETPLSTAGKRYSTTGAWTSEVTTHFKTQSNRIDRTR